jgi:hypothetical protein
VRVVGKLAKEGTTYKLFQSLFGLQSLGGNV